MQFNLICPANRQPNHGHKLPHHTRQPRSGGWERRRSNIGGDGRITADEITAVGGVDKSTAEIRALDGAEHQLIVKWQEHLQVTVGNLAPVQIIGTAD